MSKGKKYCQDPKINRFKQFDGFKKSIEYIKVS